MMKEKGKLNDNLSDIKDFENIFVDLGRVYDNPPMTKKERLIYQLTDNGHRFIPSFFLKKDIGVIPQDWCVTPAKNYMHKQLLAVNPNAKAGILRNMDKKAYKQLIKRYKKLMKQYDKNFDKVTAEYQSKQKYLTSIEFWNKYLGI